MNKVDYWLYKPTDFYDGIGLERFGSQWVLKYVNGDKDYQYKNNDSIILDDKDLLRLKGIIANLISEGKLVNDGLSCVGGEKDSGEKLEAVHNRTSSSILEQDKKEGSNPSLSNIPLLKKREELEAGKKLMLERINRPDDYKIEHIYKFYIEYCAKLELLDDVVGKIKEYQKWLRKEISKERPNDLESIGYETALMKCLKKSKKVFGEVKK